MDAVFQINKFQFELGEHNAKDVIWIHFPNDLQLRNHLRKHIKAHWSNSMKCWYAFDTTAYRKLFGLPEKIMGKNAIFKVGDVNLPELERYVSLLKLKAYSINTQRTYCTEFIQFLAILKNHKAAELTPEQLRSYFLYCVRTLKISEAALHSRINAVKFYYEQALHHDRMFFDIPRPKSPLKLPKVLNVKEVKKLFEVTTNHKHLLMLKLCYGMGLRVSEVVRLKTGNIDSQRMQVLIEGAKGKKDRYVNLPHSILEELRAHYREYKPKGAYLFEGQYGDQYSIRSVQAVFKAAMQKAGIKKNIGIHGLRHSYATHLLEYGTDISLIQNLLGHNNIKTTLIYAHVGKKEVAKVKSPLDTM